MISNNEQYAQVFVRMALAATMLSAVADRFGFWGDNAAWGNWQNFIQYTRQLTPFIPEALSKISAYVATILEIGLSLMLLLGFKTKQAAMATGCLLLIFALSMSFSLGIKAPLDYSVWIGSAAAFLVGNHNRTLT